MPRPFRATAMTAALLFVGGCPSAELGLVVELRTDFVPGVELAAVRTSLYAAHPDEGGEPTEQRSTPALAGMDFVTGERIGDFDVASGRIYVRAELLAPDGSLLAERIASVETTVTRALTLVVSRSCRGITCASPGEVCIGGSCQPCTTEPCIDGCGADADCASPGSDCAEARCLDGSCYVVTLEGACMTGEWCHPELGCMALPEVPDGGMCTPSCAGLECGNDGCGGSCGSCMGGESCVSGTCTPCTPDCAGRECGLDPVCGASCGTCSPPEVCSGSTCIPDCSPNCSGRTCGDDGCGGSCGTCTPPATCSGGNCVCTPDCSGRECGNDPVCDTSCGTCGAGSSCTGTTCCDVNGDSCGGPTCCSPWVCTDGRCCTPVGMGCGSSGECCNTRLCVLGRCCVVLGDLCSSADQCCNFEGGFRACMGARGCCVTLGGGCSMDGQCCTNNCVTGSCQP